MSQIQNDTEFKNALQSLPYAQQRVVAAFFVKHVLPLCNDQRLKRILDIASDINATDDDLNQSLKSARAVTLDSHTRCGAEGNWNDQAGYFVARAAIAAVTPESQSKAGGPAWQAAMSSRMAQTSIQIDHEETQPANTQWQYDILAGFLNS